LKIIGNILIAASALFFLESSFEMYFLTLVHGQQMLFFSLAHIAPFALNVIILSGLAFVCIAVFALVIQLLRFTRRLSCSPGFAKFMLVIFCVQLVHIMLLLTYDAWAGALFSNHGI
jgi:hypothetical protein